MAISIYSRNAFSQKREKVSNVRYFTYLYPTYGYFVGGSTGAAVATADRITFSTGTTAAFTAANLSTGRFGLAALSDKVTYGYFAGGNTGANVASFERITFSSGTTVSFTAANLSQARSLLAGLSDASEYGYFAGGSTGADINVATADRVTFSTGTAAAFTAANLSQARRVLTALSDGTTYGYFAGGFISANTNVADRIAFSTGTTAAYTAANLSEARRGLAGLSDAITYGYFIAGRTTVYVVTADRITFSTGTTAAYTAANLQTGKGFLASSSDGNEYGYIAGGLTGSDVYVATADRIVFSTGTREAFTSANLSQARSSLAGLADYAI
jgi:hypothetical protein